MELICQERIQPNLLSNNTRMEIGNIKQNLTIDSRWLSISYIHIYVFYYHEYNDKQYILNKNYIYKNRLWALYKKSNLPKL